MSEESKDQTPTRIRKTPYKSKYPYNKVRVTESGHEFHEDDTPGNERLRTAHKSGSYDEIHPEGSRTAYTVGHEQEYVKGGATRTVDENQDDKVGGHHRELVNGGTHKEYGGDVEITCGGDYRIVALGNGKFAISGVLYIGVRGDANIHVGGKTDIISEGDTTLTTPTLNVNANVNIKGNLDVDGKVHNTGDMNTDGVHTDSLGHHS